MEIQLFNSPQFGDIRTAGTPDNPMFCLADVCRTLELTPSKVAQRLDGDVLSKYTLQTNGGEQLMNFVNEDGLYDVILDSRKPEAKAFRKWITSEVIPSIRRTGGYIQARQDDTPEEIMAKALMIADKTMKRQNQRIQMLEGQTALLEQENKKLAPKAQYTDEVLQAGGTYTHTEMAKELNFRSCYVFLKALKDEGILFKDQGGMYLLYAKYSGHRYTTTRTNRFFKPDGSVGTDPITVWTEQGRMFLHDKFKVPMQPIDASDIFSN